MTTQMKIKTYLVAGIKAALLDTTGIKLASKSETTSHTYTTSSACRSII